jgi:hypothetical protein
VSRRALVVALALALAVAACDRVIDLSRRSGDAGAGNDVGAVGDGGAGDGVPGDGGVDDGGGGGAD